MPKPLRWTVYDAPALIAPDGVWHRVWCPRIEDEDGTRSEHVKPGEHREYLVAPHACQHCRPTLINDL